VDHGFGAGGQDSSTWYLAINLPHPDASHATTSPHPPADLAEIIRLYSLRPWIEQSYKQIKDELGWADFQVRSDRAIRRHQTLVNCAFSFCCSTVCRLPRVTVWWIITPWTGSPVRADPDNRCSEGDSGRDPSFCPVVG
jgi:hypothetical protein